MKSGFRVEKGCNIIREVQQSPLFALDFLQLTLERNPFCRSHLGIEVSGLGSEFCFSLASLIPVVSTGFPCSLADICRVAFFGLGVEVVDLSWCWPLSCASLCRAAIWSSKVLLEVLMSLS